MAHERSAPKSSTPQLLDELLVDEILARLPAAAVARFRAVCRAWNAALTSDAFVLAHRARSAAARQPEILFFMPAPGGAPTPGTSLYTCSLRNGEAPSAARELLTVANLCAEHAVLSPRPCHGLTLVFDAQAPAYFVCNLSTGEHVALPPCEPAAAIQSPVSMRIGVAGSHLQFLPWIPFELASAGIGFDPATGEHKVVRLFKNRIGRTACCEVCIPRSGGGWRPPSDGRGPPPHAASFVAGLPPVFLGGSLYWLLDVGCGAGDDRLILSFSVGAEQFGWVHMPRLLSRRVGNLTDLDGSLCAVVDLRLDAGRYALFTWSGKTTSSWSLRYSICLGSLRPRAVSDEFEEEQDVVPLCCAGGKILLATGRHKVFAYDPEGNTMERVFCVQEFVDLPDCHREARLRLNIGLHEESVVSFRQRKAHADDKRLQVKMGSITLAKREVTDENRDDRLRKLRDLFKDLSRKHLNQN